MLRLLYGPTLISVHACWKNYSLDHTTFVGKMMSLLYNKPSRFVIASKEQVSFNFMAAVTVLSDFGTQENKVCHSFHFFPIYGGGGGLV